MNRHIEYDDFGEYVEEMMDGELVVVEEKQCKGLTELILFDEGAA